MKSTLILTTTLFLTTLFLYYKPPLSQNVNLQASNSNPWDIYDYYFFALQWGASMCAKTGKTCYEKLKSVPRHEVTIHGLWPSLLKGKNLPACNSGAEISIIDDDRMKEARTYWPSLNGNANTVFWGHEYNKHGYCYNKRLGFPEDDYHYYFDKAMELFKSKKLNRLIINAIGDHEGIQKISYNDLYAGIKKVLGGDYFQITCSNVSKKQYLAEIRIGFNLNFEFTKITKGTGCSNKKDIIIEFTQ